MTKPKKEQESLIHCRSKLIMQKETPTAIFVSIDEEHEAVWVRKDRVSFNVLRRLMPSGFKLIDAEIPLELALKLELI